MLSSRVMPDLIPKEHKNEDKEKGKKKNAHSLRKAVPLLYKEEGER